MDDVIPGLAERVFEVLQRMAVEAGPTFALRGFARWTHGRFVDSWEKDITDGIEDRIRLDGIGTIERDKRYPRSATEKMRALIQSRGKRRNFCDIKVRLNEGGYIWIECKGIFGCVLSKRDRQRPDYWSGRWKDCSEAGAQTETSINEVAIDLRKLECLESRHAAGIAMLVLGFDLADQPLARRPTFVDRNARLVSEGWSLGEKHWNDHNEDRSELGFREHLWLFGRAGV